MTGDVGSVGSMGSMQMLHHCATMAPRRSRSRDLGQLFEGSLDDSSLHMAGLRRFSSTALSHGELDRQAPDATGDCRAYARPCKQ